MGIGKTSGQARARDAAEAAVSGRLLSRHDLARAAGGLVGAAGDEILKVREAADAEMVVSVSAGWNTGVITSGFADSGMRSKARVSMLVTGVTR